MLLLRPATAIRLLVLQFGLSCGARTSQTVTIAAETWQATSKTKSEWVCSEAGRYALCSSAAEHEP